MKKTKNEAMRERLLRRPGTEEARLALEKDETDPLLWYDYAMSLSDSDEAIDAFSQGLIHFPFDSLLRFGRGRKYLSSGRYKMALADFTMAIRIEPEIYSHWYYRAMTNNLAGNQDAALADYAEACQHTQQWEQYGLVYWMFVMAVEKGDRKQAEAIAAAMPGDLKEPQMHYGYKRNVQLFKGIISPEAFIDEEDIRAHMVDQDDRFTLEMVSLLYGLYVYYDFVDDQEKANATLLRLLKYPYPGAFGYIKANKAAKDRGLI